VRIDHGRQVEEPDVGQGQVMFPAHARFGALAVKVRPSRPGAGGSIRSRFDFINRDGFLLYKK